LDNNGSVNIFVYIPFVNNTYLIITYAIITQIFSSFTFAMAKWR